jgi:hypothetical protein
MALQTRSELLARAANSDTGLDLALRVAHAHKPFGHTGDAKDSELRGLRAWGYCVAGFYHEERNHQGKENKLLLPRQTQAVGSDQGSVQCQERLGGLLKYYYRQAA